MSVLQTLIHITASCTLLIHTANEGIQKVSRLQKGSNAVRDTKWRPVWTLLQQRKDTTRHDTTRRAAEERALVQFEWRARNVCNLMFFLLRVAQLEAVVNT